MIANKPAPAAATGVNPNGRVADATPQISAPKMKKRK
jgi:hypothetical protein